MFQKEVTTKSGVKKNVIAGSQKDLDEAVKNVEAEEAPTYPNINVPVKKGHDLVEIQPDMSVELVDGTGAHNSPYDAINNDGSEAGDKGIDAYDHSEPARVSNVPETPSATNTEVNPSVEARDEARKEKKSRNPLKRNKK